MSTAAPEDEKLEVFKYYGSFARTMLTMFEILLGNFMLPCRALVEKVSEWWMVFFLWHRVVIGFSVLTVISGVFIQETFQVAAKDDHSMIIRMEREASNHIFKMSELFRNADTDGNGFLDLDEWTAIMDDEVVKKWLVSMGLDFEDARTLFKLIGGGNEITAEELIRGAARLKGQARSIDLHALVAEHRHLKMLLKQIDEMLKSSLVTRRESGGRDSNQPKASTASAPSTPKVSARKGSRSCSPSNSWSL